ncbi:MAG: outer membrane protein assembly factor BamA [Pseudomonadota bacterium]
MSAGSREAARGLTGALALLLAAALLAGGLAPRAAAQEAPVIERVERILVEGARRVDEATILAYMTVQEGEPATAAQINASLRRLLDTGLFEDVVISPMGDGLLVQVEEAAFVNRVEFEGNDALEDETLRGAVRSSPRSAFSRAQADADARTLLEIYRRSGYYGATVEPVIIERENNRVDLVFEIQEGSRTGVRSIEFVGNKAFSDSRLRDAVETRENGLFAFILGSNTYDPDRLEFDKEQLRRFYLERGYADIEVLSATAELTSDREDFLITFTVDEGQVYRFGELGLDIRIPGVDPEAYQDVFVARSGEVYDVSEVDDSIEALIFELGQEGYAFVDVRPRAEKDTEEKTIDVTLEVSEAPRVYIERIEINGNTRTVDRVLRRQFKVVEGDAYNAREIESARQRLRALDFFSRVNVSTEQGSGPDRAVVNVDVEERLTGSISFGLGFSSSVGPQGEISITERNFLGRGQYVRALANFTGDDRALSFSFREPALLDRDLSAGFAVGYVSLDRVDESSYEETNIFFRPYTDFPIAPDQRLRLDYSLSSDEIRDVSDFASPAIQADEGTAITSMIGATWTMDKRNDLIEPTRGYLLRFEQDLAGLAGDMYYARSVARAKGWQGFFDDEVVASLEIEGGAIVSLDEDLRVADRFMLGGDSFRGFARGGIGPRDVSTYTDPDSGDERKRDDALGGKYYAVARANLSFPLGLPEELGMYGGLFADVGTVWALDRTQYTDEVDGDSVTIDDALNLRASVGASLYVDSPFGPLEFNLAYPALAEDEDEKEYFRFSVGTRF